MSGFAQRDSAQQIDGVADDNSVESAIFSALKRVHLIDDISKCHYQRCGRTDAGVSAFNQVISLYLRSNLRSGVEFVDEFDPSIPYNAPNAAPNASNQPQSAPSSSTPVTEFDYASVGTAVISRSRCWTKCFRPPFGSPAGAPSTELSALVTRVAVRIGPRIYPQAACIATTFFGEITTWNWCDRRWNCSKGSTISGTSAESTRWMSAISRVRCSAGMSWRSERGTMRRGDWFLQRNAAARRAGRGDCGSRVLVASGRPSVSRVLVDSVHDEHSFLGGVEKGEANDHLRSPRCIEKPLQTAVSSRGSRAPRSLRLRVQPGQARGFADGSQLSVHSIAPAVCSHSPKQHGEIQRSALLVWRQFVRFCARGASQSLRREGVSDADSWGLRAAAAEWNSRGICGEIRSQRRTGGRLPGSCCSEIHTARTEIESTLDWMKGVRNSVVWRPNSEYGWKCTEETSESVSVYWLWEEWVYSGCDKGKVG